MQTTAFRPAWTVALALATTFGVFSPVGAAEPVAGEIRLSAGQMTLIELASQPVERGELTLDLSLTGEITPDLDRTVEVFPRAAGIVRDVSGRQGQTLRAGAVLAVLDSGASSEAEAAYQAALAREDLTRTRLAKEEALWNKKISAEQDYLQARQEATEAALELKKARDRLRLLGLTLPRTGSFPPSAAGGRLLPVVAPIDGTVIERKVAAGDQVGETSALFRIANLDSVWVIAGVPESDMGRVAVGQPAEVILSAHPGRRFEGRVTWVSDVLDDRTRTLPVRIELDNRERLLKPGGFARITVSARASGALTVPLAAVQRQKAEHIVFVESGAGRFQRREVRLGAASRDRVVVMDGLEAGERVVTRGAFALKSELEKSAFVDQD